MSRTATRIRVFGEGDYAALAEINNATLPEFASTAGEIAYHDRQRDRDAQDPDKPVKWRRWVWEENGRVLGSGKYSQDAWCFHPRKFDLYVSVHPDFQRRGIGGELYRHVLETVTEFDPVKLSSWICAEKAPDAPGFLERRGYRAGMRTWDSKLDLMAWDPAPFAGAVARVEDQGLRLVSLDLLMEELPDWDRLIYEFEREVWKDIPLPDEQTDPGFEWYRRQVLESPHLYPEASWFAMDGDRPVGLSALWKQESGDHLATTLTGTARSHRGRGIATALKVKALAFAKERGHPWVRTDNEENNLGMVSINRKLGFVDYPSWQCYEKILKEGP